MKTILLTGASGGIGQAILGSLEALGHEVSSVTRDDADMGSYDDIKAFADGLPAEQSFDWIVFCHGFIDDETVLEKQTPEDIATTFDVNTLSIVYLTRELLSRVCPGGGIIAISSTAGIGANGRFAVYSASKAAVNIFMQAMARNRSEQKFFALCPGPTSTVMLDKIGGDLAKAQDPREVARVITCIVNGSAPYKSGDVIAVRDGKETVASSL